MFQSALLTHCSRLMQLLKAYLGKLVLEMFGMLNVELKSMIQNLIAIVALFEFLQQMEWVDFIGILPVQLPLDLTFALKWPEFKYLLQSCLCDILGLCDIAPLLHKQLCGKYFYFDCSGPNVRSRAVVLSKSHYYL